MKGFIVAALLAAGAAIPAYAADPKSGSAPDPALVDAIVRKLESEGVLDRAVERGAFARCLADVKVARRVEEDYADGTAAGITGTPSTLIRHNRTGATEIVVGAQPAEALAAVIERMLDGGR